MGEKPLSHRQKSSLKFVEQDDPPFIKQMKTKMGYREPATISDKFAMNVEVEEDPTQDKDDIRNLAEEERPQIVIVNSETDVSKEQLEKEIENFRDEEDRKKIEEGKIVFRRPEKRVHEEKEKTNKIKSKKASINRNQNSKLLSFNDDEEDND